MLDVQPDFPLTLTNVIWAIGAVGVVAGASAGITWNVLKERIQQLRDELQTLKEAEDWGLPETLKSLKQVSAKLRLDIDERQAFEKLQADHSRLAEAAAADAETIRNLQRHTTDLEQEVASLRTVGAEFVLAVGETVELVKPYIAVGFTGVTLDTANIVFMNKEQGLTVGKQLKADFGGRHYQLTLLNLDKSQNPYRAKFSFYSLDKT